MSKSWLINKIIQYQSIYPSEHKICQQYLQFLHENQTCFSRSQPYGHVTTSSWLINQSSDKVLLCFHKKLNKLVQLGGHADGNENVLNVCRREIAEESGIKEVTLLSQQIFDLNIYSVPKYQDTPSHFHFDVCFLWQAHYSKYKVSSESKKLVWVKITDIPKLTQDTSLIQMAKKYHN